MNRTEFTKAPVLRIDTFVNVTIESISENISSPERREGGEMISQVQWV